MAKNSGLKEYSLSEVEHKKILGRTLPKTDPLYLFWSGSGIEFCFQGEELWLQIEADYRFYEPWICIMMDDVEVSRQMITKGKHWICLYREPNKHKKIKISLLKEIQPMVLDGLHTLKILKIRTNGIFHEIKDSDIRLEFIGDSITSGYGTIGTRAQKEYSMRWMSMSHAFPYLTSKAMDADFRIISVGGWGVFCGPDNNPKHAIPRHYDDICSVVESVRYKRIGAYEKYDFDSWKPDVIVINLGTNDSFAFGNKAYIDEKSGETYQLRTTVKGLYFEEDREKVKTAIRYFLYEIRSKNRKAHIIWAYGMLDRRLTDSIMEAIVAYQEEMNDTNISFVELPLIERQNIGSGGHPNALAHQEVATILVSKINDYLLYHYVSPFSTLE